jgi:hypothetical protein
MRKMIVAITILITISSTMAYAHSGRTNQDGCHRDRKAGTYHCH